MAILPNPNLGQGLIAPKDMPTNDAGLPLATPDVRSVDIQDFYMPDFEAVEPVPDDDANKFAISLDYDGWIVDRGHDGTRDALELPGERNTFADESPKAGFWEAFKAGAVRENELLSYTASNIAGKDFVPVPGYNPEDEVLYRDPVYAPYADRLVFAQSKAEFDAMVMQVDQENERRRLIENRGGAGMLGMLGGQAISPMFWASMLVPEVGAVRAGRPIAAAAELMLYGAAQESGAELVKLDTQLTRTAEEALFNIGAASLLSGVIGAGAAAFNKSQMERIVGDTVTDLSNNVLLTKGPDLGDSAKLTDAEIASYQKPGKAWDDSLSAARANVENPDWWQLESALGMEKWNMNPITRLAKSGSLTARKMTTWLVNTPYYHKGHKEGINLAGPIGSVEARVNMLVDNSSAASINALRDNFLKYRGIESTLGEVKASLADITGIGKPAGKLTYDEFKTAVAKELRQTARSPVPEVQAAAKQVREKVLTPFFKSLQELDMISGDIGEDYAGRYLYRVWDAGRVAAGRRVIGADGSLVGGLEFKLSRHFLKKQKELQQKIDQWVKNTKEDSAAMDAYMKQKEAAAMEEGLEEEAKALQSALKATAFDRNDPNFVRKVMGYESNPKSLAVLIRDKGGLIDSGGELAARGINNREYPGIVTTNTKKGLRIEDELMRYVHEYDFTFGKQDYNDISMDDVLDALVEEATGPVGSRTKFWNDDITFGLAHYEAGLKGVDEEMLAKTGLPSTASRKEVKEYLLAQRGSSLEEFNETLNVLRKEAKEGYAAQVEALAAKESMAEFLSLPIEALEKLAARTVDNILSTPSGEVAAKVLPNEAIVKASPLKDRMLVDIDEVDYEDFFVNDAESVLRAYINSVAPQMEIKRTFGNANMDEVFEDIKVEYAQHRDAVADDMRANGASEEAIQQEMLKVNQQMENDLHDVMALRDKLLGNYNKPDDPDGFWIRASQFIKRYNLLRSLGGMQLAALTDISRPVMVKGFRPVIRTMRALNTSAAKVGKLELQKAGVGYEALLNSRFKSWADVTDDFTRRNKMEKGIDSLAMGFGKATGMSFHNDFAKSFSGLMIQDEILRAGRKAAAGEALTAKELRDAAKSGIGLDQLKKIGDEMNAGGVMEEGGLMAPLSERWTDQDLVLAFRSAVRKSVDEVIVTVGKGEMPLWMSHELGSHIMQFKSFLVSSHSRALISGLQARDMAALEGLIVAVGLGYMVSVIKDQLGNNPGSFQQKEFGAQMVDSVDRAGVLGWLMEPYGIANKMTGGQVAVSRLWGGEADQLSRYQSRNLWGSIGGVSTDLLGDVASVSSSLSTGEVSDGDVNAMRKLIPYQNLWYLDKLFDSISNEAKDTFVTN